MLYLSNFLRIISGICTRDMYSKIYLIEWNRYLSRREVLLTINMQRIDTVRVDRIGFDTLRVDKVPFFRYRYLTLLGIDTLRFFMYRYLLTFF